MKVDVKPGSAVRPLALGAFDPRFEHRPDGSLLAHEAQPLGAYPRSLTDHLAHWARTTPDRPYLARRHKSGDWRRITYAEAWTQVQQIAAALLSRGLSPERPIAILSGNSLEHALLALAALHVGIPYVPVSVAYSLVSTDFGKLRHIVETTTPGLIFADDGAPFAKAIAAVISPETEILVVENPPTPAATLWENLAQPITPAVAAAAAAVSPDSVAKFLFTSGSTGLPKGVINTQRMLCANQQQILEALPFLAETPPVLVDWTPWNHTFGGNHDFGLILANGGTLYIDDGKPVPGLVEESIRNLREISPTFYLNVPKGYEELVAYLQREPALRKTFFANLQLMFYAGAGLAQHVWDALDALAVETVGERITMLAGFGSTETAPFCLIARPDCAQAGVVGLPARGVALKLVPNADKLEARVRGPNITPGYWRQPELTAAAFDEEGFYKLGDAMAWVDPARPELGFRFDGRTSEDFKLATGTWVSVGTLRAGLVAGLAPYIRDAVIAGIDRDYVAALLIPNVDACRTLADADDWPTHPRLHAALAAALGKLAAAATGSASRIRRATLLHHSLDSDAGEITDKGSLNQRAVLRHRAPLVADLFADPRPPHIISIED